MNDIPAIGPASKAFLANPAATIFNPSGIAKPKPKDLGSIISGIKPPDFSARPLGLATSGDAAFRKAAQDFNKGVFPKAPTINLPNFSALIPKIKIDKP
jgi:hypothetical protein